MKRIKIKYIEHPENEKVIFYISEQTNRGCSFGVDSNSYWFDSEGFKLISGKNYPSVSITDNLLYVRSDNTDSNDNTIMIVGDVFFEKIKNAVKEYNKYFSDKKEIKSEDGWKEIS